MDANKPRVERYYAPFELGIFVMVRKLSMICLAVCGIGITLLTAKSWFANIECQDSCDYGGCMSFFYPYSFWALPSMIILAGGLCFLIIYCTDKIANCRWKE
jgi:hypothetical protein